MCATARSGSTLLCEALAATGVAGRPREEFEQLSHSGLRRQPREYFSSLADPSIGGLLPEQPAELGPALPDGPYAIHVRAAIKRGTTPNGVFATKLMWGYLGDFLARTGPDIDATFGAPAYVLVVRRDKLRQAISLWRAVQDAELAPRHRQPWDQRPAALLGRRNRALAQPAHDARGGVA